MQVQESFRDYGRQLGLQSTTIFGGVGIQPQINALRKSLDVVVATPGRLLDHMQQRTVDLSGIEILTLDEADRMLDMGFIPSIRRILQSLPKNRHTLLFSATFSNKFSSVTCTGPAPKVACRVWLCRCKAISRDSEMSSST